MAGLYTRRSHERELRAQREGYEEKLGELRAAIAELKEENRRLAAEVSLLHSQKDAVSDAMIAAGEAKTRMEAEFGEFVRSEKEIAVQAAEKAQALLEEVRSAYPDEADDERFGAFERRLHALLGDDGSVSAAIPDMASEGAEAPPAETKGEWALEEVLETLGLSED